MQNLLITVTTKRINVGGLTLCLGYKLGLKQILSHIYTANM